MGNFWLNVKLIAGLLFIIALAYYSIRLLGRQTAALSRNRFIKIVSAQPLGQNKSLQVVVIDDKTVLVLGVASQIDCVARFDDRDLAEKLLSETRTRDFPTRLPFGWISEYFQTRARGRGKRQVSDFADVLNDRMRSIRDTREREYDQVTGKSARSGGRSEPRDPLRRDIDDRMR